MTYEAWGPLGGLVGTWESGWTGLDVAFHNDKGKIAETPYREKTTFKPFGPVDNGTQSLYGLDYRTAAWKEGEENPFHTEVGYWMWDESNHQVMRCFLIPRASALIAGATVAPDATSFKLECVLGSNTMTNRATARAATSASPPTPNRPKRSQRRIGSLRKISGGWAAPRRAR